MFFHAFVTLKQQIQIEKANKCESTLLGYLYSKIIRPQGKLSSHIKGSGCEWCVTVPDFRY